MNEEHVTVNLLRMDLALAVLATLFLTPYAGYQIYQFVRYMPVSSATGMFWMDFGLFCFMNGLVLLCWSNLHKSLVNVR